MAELQTKNNLSTEWCNNTMGFAWVSITIGWGNFPTMNVPYVSRSWQMLKNWSVLLHSAKSGKDLGRWVAFLLFFLIVFEG